jgi:hypothetical protein
VHHPAIAAWHGEDDIQPEQAMDLLNSIDGLSEDQISSLLSRLSSNKDSIQ